MRLARSASTHSKPIALRPTCAPDVTVSRAMDASEGRLFDDGRFNTLLDAVNHDDTQFNLNLSDASKRDLVEYLKGI